ncbi:MAG: T9SS type A sorting domain-containing protein [Bacteroidetes bacterium]|nr:T9SS type A sorting domain-containing protein [Bacteroidota bacterium]
MNHFVFTFLLIVFFIPFNFCSLSAQNKIINGPSGSGQFGKTVTVLPNGNYVVTDPLFDNSLTDVGAVYLYNGATHALISTLTGSTANDQVGSGGISILTNGNYVVRSVNWDNGAIANAGAVTWGNGTTGVVGVVSASNSLVGSVTNDQIGFNGITVLSNGNYVIGSPNWDNGAIANAGAVTWGNGTTGSVGVVSASNSLIGSSANDQIGSSTITVLSNANYVVRSLDWDNGAIADAGAVTWCDGTTGKVGVVSASNSLVGSVTNDQIGFNGITVLSNGNYVIGCPNWDNGAIANAGAVTWCNGTTGRVGPVNASNSLVGSSANDAIGGSGITALTNGNYVVSSRNWDNGAIAQAGAVTWGNGTTGIVGTVSASNSLIGSAASDLIGNNGITALSNGNYVVTSNSWDNGAIVDAGAVTWGNGTIGIVGAVSASNSLVGSSANDAFGGGAITALTNGNYVVTRPFWDNGAIADAGAVTWGNGTTGRVGPVSASNSLVGSSANDAIGSNGIAALSNGNYVVRSLNWDNGAIGNAGAATWCDGSTGRVGTVSASNSLVGTSANDQIGNYVIAALSNGNYVVRSPSWDNGAIADAGAVTWGNGTTGIVGAISASNSLVGSSANDNTGNGGITALTNGNYVVGSPNWDNGVIANAGAVTWGNGTTGSVGIVSASNSLVGSSASDLIGSNGITALSNGNYVVTSNSWDNGVIANAGAVTWGNGTTGRVGAVSASNSLVGSQANDQIGNNGVTALTNGNYVVGSSFWDNGAFINAGAITIAADNAEIIGTINNCNSVLGSAANPSITLFSAFDSAFNYLIVSKPSENKIVIRSFSFNFNFNQTICANQSFLWNGIARNTSGAFKDTFTSFSGCDSVVSLNLTVKPTSSSSINQTICANQSFLWNGIARNTSGAFKDTFTSFNGCDSVVTLNLTVTPLPSKLTNTTGNTITAAQAGATYQWINCATNTIIAEANAESFTPSFNGSFKVVVTQTNCSDTSACVPINSVGLNQNNLSQQVRIYPNPARESLTISLSDEDFHASIVLLSLDGKKILTYYLNQKINTLPISHLVPGFYLYEISFRGNIEKGKLLIQE